MHFATIQRILGLLLMVASATMLPPMLIGLWLNEASWADFAITLAVVFVAGALFWYPVRRKRQELRVRDGFVVVALFWAVLALVGAIPLVLAEQPQMGFTDAMFESTSGLTTTGATVMTGIDRLPLAIKFYRQELQWLGGMGIIVLAVAVLPMLGIGGMQLYRAETPGPMKDNKLTPRITETAKALWYIYLGLTISCALGYWFAGMDVFDAIAHSFSTVAIGGFSTHDLSIGYYHSAAIEIVAVVFMLLAGVNFSLHFVAWRSMNPLTYFRDSEFKAYITVLGLAALITVAYLYLSDTFQDFSDALHHGIFQAVSIGTTTGFTTAAYSHWPGFLAGDAVVYQFHRWLRRFNRWRYESDPISAVVQAGLAGNYSPGASQCADTGESWQQSHAGAGNRGGVGVFRHLCWLFYGHDAGAAGDRAGSGDGILGGGRLS